MRFFAALTLVLATVAVFASPAAAVQPFEPGVPSFPICFMGQFGQPSGCFPRVQRRITLRGEMS